MCAAKQHMAWFSELSPEERRSLKVIENDWPGCLGLVERIAEGLLAAKPFGGPFLVAMVRSGISAYQAALQAGDDDPERFGSFVDGLADGLPRKLQSHVARALDRGQRTALARRLPPSQDADSPHGGDDGDAR